MAFNFLLVVVAVFIINMGTAVAEEHDDCYDYDVKLPNGKKKIDLYHDCGITDAKKMNPERAKCMVEAQQAVNEDGTINEQKAQEVISESAYPEYKKELLELVEELLKNQENFYSLYPNGVAKICPKDRMYGNP